MESIIDFAKDYFEKFTTSDNRRSYLKLKYYGGDDWRLYRGNSKIPGYELSDCSINNIDDSLQSECERCSLSRAKHEIIEICRCNDFKYFVTLTVSSSSCDRFSLENCQDLLKRLLKEYHRRCKRSGVSFKYIIITEKHERGGFHFHGLFTDILNDDIIINNNNYPTSKFFNEKLGFFSFSTIRSKRKCAFYISKYITKCPIKSSTNQLYFCSKGLARAEVFDLPQSAEDYKTLSDFWSFKNDYISVKDFEFSKIEKKYQLFLLNKIH